MSHTTTLDSLYDLLDSMHLFDESHSVPDVHRASDIEHATHENDTVSKAGDGEHDRDYWRAQTGDFTCAVMAQRGIIEEYTGVDYNEVDVATEAAQHGFLTVENGTIPYDVGKLLTLHGIENHRITDACIGDIVAELAQGHKVIVGVDGDELWSGEDQHDLFSGMANHAIWVTEVDMSDPSNPVVTVNDSGDPDGAGKSYGLELFKAAWEDSGYMYVATDHPPPGLGARAESFDEESGIFPDIVQWLKEHTSDSMRMGLSVGAGLLVGEAFDSHILGVAAHQITGQMLDKFGVDSTSKSEDSSVVEMSEQERINLLNNI